MMKRVLLILSLLVLPLSVHAQSAQKHCAGSICTEAEVGPFLQGIQSSCYNTGDCSLADAMITLTNGGNYLLGIVGALVLLMYVISGLRFIGAAYLPGGMDENIKAGKQGIRIATVGLIIVFGAYAAVQTLTAILRGDTSSSPSPAVVVCTEDNNGTECGFNQICSGGLCTSECEAQFAFHQCVDITDASNASRFDLSGCAANLCPGSASIQCCPVRNTP